MKSLHQQIPIPLALQIKTQEHTFSILASLGWLIVLVSFESQPQTRENCNYRDIIQAAKCRFNLAADQPKYTEPSAVQNMHLWRCVIFICNLLWLAPASPNGHGNRRQLQEHFQHQPWELDLVSTKLVDLAHSPVSTPYSRQVRYNLTKHTHDKLS